MVEIPRSRTLISVLLLMGDIRLAVVAATTLLLATRQQVASVVVLVTLALPLVWFLRRPRPLLDRSPPWSWVVTLLDVSVSVIVLAVSGVDSFALIYLAVTVALAGLRLGFPGFVVALAGTAAVHLWAYLAVAGEGMMLKLTLVLAVRLGLIAAIGFATTRLREVLLASEELTIELQRLRELSIREAERQRLARDMHDSLAKTLHGAVLLGRRLRGRLCHEPDRQGAAVVLEALLLAQDQARQVLSSLRELPVADVRRALIELAARWQEQTGIPVAVQMPETDPPLPPAARAEILAAVGELLENVQRHASATTVGLEMACSADEVMLSVTDDGKGLSVIDLESFGEGGHYGLIGVRERMVQLGGALAFRVPDVTGLAVVLTVPIVPTAAELTRGVLPTRAELSGEVR